MGDSGPFYQVEFKPKWLPRQAVVIAGEYYEIVEVRPAFEWSYKATNITAETEVNLKEKGLKGLENELLDVRLKIQGPVQVLLRVEGAGGPVFGGWGGEERYADERTKPQLLELLILGDVKGWIYARIKPIVTPAWCKLSAEGFVYIVKKLPKAPTQYSVPAYIAKPSSEVR